METGVQLDRSEPDSAVLLALAVPRFLLALDLRDALHLILSTLTLRRRLQNVVFQRRLAGYAPSRHRSRDASRSDLSGPHSRPLDPESVDKLHKLNDTQDSITFTSHCGIPFAICFCGTGDQFPLPLRRDRGYFPQETRGFSC